MYRLSNVTHSYGPSISLLISAVGNLLFCLHWTWSVLKYLLCILLAWITVAVDGLDQWVLTESLTAYFRHVNTHLNWLLNGTLNYGNPYLLSMSIYISLVSYAKYLTINSRYIMNYFIFKFLNCTNFIKIRFYRNTLDEAFNIYEKSSFARPNLLNDNIVFMTVI